MSIADCRTGRTFASGFAAQAPADWTARSTMLIEAVCEVVRIWRKRARDRAALARMAELALRDLGVDPATVWHEARRPFWQSAHEARSEIALSRRASASRQ
ncbi:MAG TPA: hypothetical protein VN832_10760 [Stellaceae bacterium]|nr:hypothetical protein [Stellaceae bacterium]